MEKVVANPFQTGGMIRTEDKFFGRESELRQIFSRLASMQSVSIVGERRMGKSSLLWRIAQTGKSRLGDQFELYYLDLERIFSTEEFYEQVCKLLGREEAATHADLAEAINKRQVILCLDEFEQTDEENFDPEFFKSLRSLAQTGELALVVATQHPLSQLYRRHGNQTSPFQNIFTQLKLDELTPEEARRLVGAQNNGHSFNPDEIKFILELAGNHPYWLNTACALVYDSKQTGGFNAEAIKRQFGEIRKASLPTHSLNSHASASQSPLPDNHSSQSNATGKQDSSQVTASNAASNGLGRLAMFMALAALGIGSFTAKDSSPFGMIISLGLLVFSLFLLTKSFLRPGETQ